MHGALESGRRVHLGVAWDGIRAVSMAEWISNVDESKLPREVCRYLRLENRLVHVFTQLRSFSPANPCHVDCLIS